MGIHRIALNQFFFRIDKTRIIVSAERISK